MTDVTPRIDAHHHVWDLAVRDQPWTAELPQLHRSYDLDELRPSLRENNISGTVVVQTMNEPNETPELLHLAATDPDVVGVVGWTDLTAPDGADRISGLRDGPGGHTLVGIRHQVQGEPDPGWLNRPDVRRGLAALAAAGLAYDLIVTVDQLPAVIDTVGAVPELRFVLDHAGKPDVRSGALEPWASSIAALSRRPNVAVKLSGLATEADLDHWSIGQLRPYADLLLEAFGPDRVIYGSDWPVCLLAGSYTRICAAAAVLVQPFSPDEQHRVFGGNAAHWYGLGRWRR